MRARKEVATTRFAALPTQLHNAGQSFQFWLVIEVASSVFNLVVVAIWVVICILHCDILESLMESHSTHSAHICTRADAVTQMQSHKCTHPLVGAPGPRGRAAPSPHTCCTHARARSKPTNARTHAFKGFIPKHVACDGT